MEVPLDRTQTASLVANGMCHATLGFYVDNLPANEHLMVATRVDPPLPGYGPAVTWSSCAWPKLASPAPRPQQCHEGIYWRGVREGVLAASAIRSTTS